MMELCRICSASELSAFQSPGSETRHHIFRISFLCSWRSFIPFGSRSYFFIRDLDPLNAPIGIGELNPSTLPIGAALKFFILVGLPFVPGNAAFPVSFDFLPELSPNLTA